MIHDAQVEVTCDSEPGSCRTSGGMQAIKNRGHAPNMTTVKRLSRLVRLRRYAIMKFNQGNSFFDRITFTEKLQSD